MCFFSVLTPYPSPLGAARFIKDPFHLNPLVFQTFTTSLHVCVLYFLIVRETFLSRKLVSSSYSSPVLFYSAKITGHGGHSLAVILHPSSVESPRNQAVDFFVFKQG